jgi:transposase
MLTQEAYVEISVLARQGLSIRAIAREMNCSRNTVRRYLKRRAASQAVIPRYASRAPRPCKLDPYKAYLLQRIDAARPHWIPATVLLRELHDRGYTGGYTMLTMFLLPLKEPQAEPVTRYETEPGEQMQADFTVIRRDRDPLLGFVATLGWSRGLSPQ